MRVREVRRIRTTETISLIIPTLETFSREAGKSGVNQCQNLQDTTLTIISVVQWLIGRTQIMWPQCWQPGSGTIGGWFWRRKQSSIFFSLNNSTVSSRRGNLLTFSQTWQLQRRERYCRGGSSTFLWTTRAHTTTTITTTTTIPTLESLNPCSIVPFHSYNP